LGRRRVESAELAKQTPAWESAVLIVRVRLQQQGARMKAAGKHMCVLLCHPGDPFFDVVVDKHNSSNHWIKLNVFKITTMLNF
jgi:hypothetical protein